jgi:hypothetical protein
MVIKFGPEQGQEWKHVVELFELGERSLAGIAEFRAALRIFDALEAVSEEVRGADAAGHPAVIGRRLRADGAEVELRDGDGALLRRVVRELLVDNPRRQRPLPAPAAARVLDVLTITLPEE